MTGGSTCASILSLAVVFPRFIVSVLFNSANPVDVDFFFSRLYDFANQKLEFFYSEHIFIKNVSMLKNRLNLLYLTNRFGITSACFSTLLGCMFRVRFPLILKHFLRLEISELTSRFVACAWGINRR